MGNKHRLNVTVTISSSRQLTRCPRTEIDQVDATINDDRGAYTRIDIIPTPPLWPPAAPSVMARIPTFESSAMTNPSCLYFLKSIVESSRQARVILRAAKAPTKHSRRRSLPAPQPGPARLELPHCSTVRGVSEAAPVENDR